MSKTFVYDRYDIFGRHLCGCHIEECSDGEYVRAQDAIDREAVLQARIRTLEVQLKDAKPSGVTYNVNVAGYDSPLNICRPKRQGG
jgi:hypothetical protein